MGKLRAAGKVLKLTKSGNLLLTAELFLEGGTPLYDEGSKFVGYVIETFGPVSKPYLLVKPKTDRVRKLISKTLYCREVI